MDTLSAPPTPHHWGIRFPEPLEAEFQADYTVRYLRSMQLALFAGLVALAAVGALDYYWMPTLAPRMWQIRTGCFIPMVALLALSFTQAGKKHIQTLIIASAACAAGMIVLCANIAIEPYSHYYRCGLSLVILIVFVLSRLQFMMGALTAGIILLELNAGFIVQGVSDLRQISPANFLVMASSACALAGTFLIEHHIRQNFLQGRQLAAKVHDLEEANLRLSRLSAIDGLTQLANRAALDSTLAFEWRRAQRKQSPVALIMVDVDHFKLYNDHYGHQAGDDCLRNVAHAIRSAVRRPTDLAARYGGEEFCIVLTGSAASEAAWVAEQARSRISQLGLDHPLSGHGCVTASLGVATCTPGQGTSHDSLLHAADLALYRAKENGRNCVVLADSLVPA